MTRVEHIPIKLKPRHAWFSATSKDAEEWSGPHTSLHHAALAQMIEFDAPVVYVAQGYRMSKAEREEKGVDYTWEVDTQNAIEIRLP